MNPIDILLGALFGSPMVQGAKNVVENSKKGKKQSTTKITGRDVVRSGGRSNIYRPELLQFRPMLPKVEKKPMMPRFPEPQYEDSQMMQSQGMFSPISADIRNYQMPNFRSLQQNTNPMGYTPGYNQEAYSNLQGGAPNFSSYGMQYPEGTFNSRLRVR